MGGDHHIHYRCNLHIFQYHCPVRQLTVVVQQLLNQLLQIPAAVIEDLDNLFLLRGQRASHFVRQQLGTFSHAGERRFEFMGNVTEEMMTLRFQPRQTFGKPDDPLTH